MSDYRSDIEPKPGSILQAVLPLSISGDRKRDNLIRAHTLIASLRAGFEPTQHLVVNVVGRAIELTELRTALDPLACAWLSLKFHDELTLLPELTKVSIADWYRQQLVLLSAAEWLDGDFWLALDADLVCVRRFAIEDLAPNGRPLARVTDMRAMELLQAQSASSAEVLGYERFDRTRALEPAPAIFTRPVAIGVQREIEKHAGTGWRQALLESPTLTRSVADREAGWSAAALYQAVADRHGLWAWHHTVSGLMSWDGLLLDGGLREATQAAAWTPDDAFSGRLAGYFMRAGAQGGIDPQRIAEQVAPHVARLTERVREPLPWVPPRPLSVDPEAIQYMRMVAREPAIYYTIPQGATPMGIAPLVSPMLVDQPVFFLIGLWWLFDNDDECRALIDAYRVWQPRYPHHAAIVLCNTQEQVDLISRAGISCVLCPQNLSLDENIFRPDARLERRFDAVYNAGLVPFKRHLLAREVPSLALIYGNWHVLPPEELDYVERLHEALPQASFINDLVGGGVYRMLDPKNCARWYNQSRVGLCLSAFEGAMFSSMEYLMCGLPVVSTPSRGGRDYFFDDDVALIVEPTPQAVAAGVREMIARNLDPNEIRRRTMEKVELERRKFLDLLRAIFARVGVPFPGPDLWKSFFINKMVEPVKTRELPNFILFRTHN